MRTLTTEENPYVSSGRAELRRMLAALEAADQDAQPGDRRSDAEREAVYDRIEGTIQTFMHNTRFQELVVELQQERIADAQREIEAALAPYFTCENRRRLAAQGTDAFAREHRLLSSFQSLGVAGAKAAVTILDAVLGE